MSCCGKGCYDCVKNMDQEEDSLEKDSFELLDVEDTVEEFDFSPKS